jgi:hypothetical protein
MDTDIVTAVMNSYVKGQEKERDLIVAYLRKRAGEMLVTVAQNALYAIAEEIEEMEHKANGEGKE